MDDRHIPLNGSRNFRDFGGYPTRCGGTVKRGKLFRSDGLWRLSDADHVVLSPLNIRNICDLRRAKEQEMMPTRWCVDAAVNRLHLPLIGESSPSAVDKARTRDAMQKNADSARQVMIEIYRSMVVDDQALKSLGQIFRLIAAEEALPVLIHCSGGKDRTGVSCALVLSLLGVERQDVMADYMRSQALYSDKINLEKAATQVFDHQASGEWDLDAVRPVYNVDPSYLDSALSHIDDAYDSIDDFVRRGLGLSDEEIARIRQSLIA